MLFHSCEWIFLFIFFFFCFLNSFLLYFIFMISIESLCTHTEHYSLFQLTFHSFNVSQSTRIYSISILEWMENDGNASLYTFHFHFHLFVCVLQKQKKRRKKYHLIPIDKLSSEQQKWWCYLFSLWHLYWSTFVCLDYGFCKQYFSTVWFVMIYNSITYFFFWFEEIVIRSTSTFESVSRKGRKTKLNWFDYHKLGHSKPLFDFRWIISIESLDYYYSFLLLMMEQIQNSYILSVFLAKETKKEWFYFENEWYCQLPFWL